MIELNIATNILRAMAGISSGQGIAQHAPNCAVHIQRDSDGIRLAAQHGGMIVLLKLDQDTDQLKDSYWSEEEESIVSVPLRMVLGQLEKMSKQVILRTELGRCSITPVGDDFATGAWCPRWTVATQLTLFPDLAQLPKPSAADLSSLTNLTVDIKELGLIHKTAKLCGSTSTQPTFGFYGSYISVRYNDLPTFWATVRALPSSIFNAYPADWVTDHDAQGDLNDIVFRALSESEKAEQEAAASAEEQLAFADEHAPACADGKTCGDCANFAEGYCKLTDDMWEAQDTACDDFQPRLEVPDDEEVAPVV